jgi:hypothetical protein
MTWLVAIPRQGLAAACVAGINVQIASQGAPTAALRNSSFFHYLEGGTRTGILTEPSELLQQLVRPITTRKES